MSLVTTCPACKTSFIVRSEQLSAQHGQVRCGNCNQVFNAFDLLKTIAEDSISPPIAPETATALTDNNPISEQIFTEPTPNPETIVTPAEDPVFENNLAELNDSDEPIQSNDSLLISSELISNAETVPDDIVDSIEARFNPMLDIEDVPIILKKSTAKKRLLASSKHPISNWIALIITICLILLATAQSIYFLRTIISIQWPEFKPYLIKACAQINCQVELPKNVNLLVIDDSDLHEDTEHPGYIHLTSTLINNARYSQAYPKLELTLTDANDIPLLRRTFMPSEYLPANTIVNNGFTAGEEVHIKLLFTASGEAVAGYRVFVTYE